MGHSSHSNKPGTRKFNFSAWLPTQLLPITNNINEAYAKHLEQQLKRKLKLNASSHSKTSDIEPGQLFIAKDFKRIKFHPYYGPKQYKVLLKLSNSDIVLQATNDNQIIQRHINDTKPIHQRHAQLTATTLPTHTKYILDNPAPSVNNQAVNTNNDSPAVTFPTMNVMQLTSPGPNPLNHSTGDIVKQFKRHTQPIQRYTDNSQLFKKKGK